VYLAYALATGLTLPKLAAIIQQQLPFSQPALMVLRNTIIWSYYALFTTKFDKSRFGNPTLIP
jgi:hypothetical protein